MLLLLMDDHLWIIINVYILLFVVTHKRRLIKTLPGRRVLSMLPRENHRKSHPQSSMVFSRVLWSPFRCTLLASELLPWVNWKTALGIRPENFNGTWYTGTTPQNVNREQPLQNLVS